MERRFPPSARLAQAIVLVALEMVVGQKALRRSITQGDYVLLRRRAFAQHGGHCGRGEWAVSLTVPGGRIARIVQPGDEVAVIGTFKISTHPGQDSGPVGQARGRAGGDAGPVPPGAGFGGGTLSSGGDAVRAS